MSKSEQIRVPPFPSRIASHNNTGHSYVCHAVYRNRIRNTLTFLWYLAPLCPFPLAFPIHSFIQNYKANHAIRPFTKFYMCFLINCNIFQILSNVIFFLLFKNVDHGQRYNTHELFLFYMPIPSSSLFTCILRSSIILLYNVFHCWMRRRESLKHFLPKSCMMILSLSLPISLQ